MYTVVDFQHVKPGKGAALSGKDRNIMTALYWNVPSIYRKSSKSPLKPRMQYLYIGNCTILSTLRHITNTIKQDQVDISYKKYECHD